MRGREGLKEVRFTCEERISMMLEELRRRGKEVQGTKEEPSTLIQGAEGNVERDPTIVQAAARNQESGKVQGEVGSQVICPKSEQKIRRGIARENKGKVSTRNSSPQTEKKST